MTPLDYALEAVEVCFVKNHPEGWQVVRAKVRGSLRAYDAVWGQQNERYEVLGVEMLGLGPLINLITGKDSGYKVGGKLDVVLKEMDGRKRTLLMDHKTLSYDFDEDQHEHLLASAQQNTYAYLCWCQKIALQGAVWDIIVKPRLKPREESSRIVKAATESRIAARAGKDSDGVGYKKGDFVPGREEVREAVPAETMDEYEERVFLSMMERKDVVFNRLTVPVIKSNFASHIHETYLWVKELHVDLNSDLHLRNPDACLQYGKPCQYLGLCTGKSHEDDGTWTTRPVVHEELNLPPDVDPTLVITNSRLSMYRLCRLKHDRHYNKGLIKIKPAHDENTYIGTIGHVGLEHYWKAIGRNQGRNL